MVTSTKSPRNNRILSKVSDVSKWKNLNKKVVQCDRCPRLREHCANVAQTKRRAYLDFDYWGKPVPNFGDPKASLLIVGLAPGAHGANRTGRMFTGDRSGDWLYRALHKAGFANQSESKDIDDGLKLVDCAITNICHCAPPQNKPTTDEVENCRDWFVDLVDQIQLRVIIALGQIAWKGILNEIYEREWLEGRRPKFSHNARVELSDSRWLLGSYHPSQQNTFTGKLTEPMFDAVFKSAKSLLKK